MGMKWFNRKGKNKILNDLINSVKCNMENNYKDSAQSDFVEFKKSFLHMVDAGELSEKDKVYYAEVIAEYEKKLEHFTHKEGPGTGKFLS